MVAARTSQRNPQHNFRAVSGLTEPPAVAGGSEVAEWRTPSATILRALWRDVAAHTSVAPPRSTAVSATAALAGGPRLSAAVLSLHAAYDIHALIAS